MQILVKKPDQIAEWLTISELYEYYIEEGGIVEGMLDCVGFGNLNPSEYSIYELMDIEQGAYSLGDYFLAYVEIAEGVCSQSEAEEFYLGEFDDIVELAKDIINNCYDLDEFTLRYIDYDKFARDLAHDVIDATVNGKIYWFRTH